MTKSPVARSLDTRRLQTFLALTRLGSMRAVAEALRTTTSTVSQQIATLAKDFGAELLEPDGRKVRLTPEGHRLAEHAVTILAAVDAARAALDPSSKPTGVLRIGGFAAAIRYSVLPFLGQAAQAYPGLRVRVSEYEPTEALNRLLADDMDLALTYDYNLAPATWNPELTAIPLWTTMWGVAVPADGPDHIDDLTQFASATWIADSRDDSDDKVLRTLAAMTGFAPRIVHRMDTLDMIDVLIASRHGVGLLPMTRPTTGGVKVLALPRFPVEFTAYAVHRSGRATWPPLRAALMSMQPTDLPPVVDWPRRNPGRRP